MAAELAVRQLVLTWEEEGIRQKVQYDAFCAGGQHAWEFEGKLRRRAFQMDGAVLYSIF